MDLKQENGVESEGTVSQLESRGRGVFRHVLFAIVIVISLLLFWAPIEALRHLALHNDEYSHTIVIPLVTLSLVYLNRRRIFAGARYAWRAGALLLLVGMVGYLMSMKYSARLGTGSGLFLMILSLVAVWIGAFTLCYGTGALRAARFPLLFMALMAPIPAAFMAKPIAFVQHGSAEVASVVFAVAHVPFFRDGMRFSLPGLDMEVAIQCSGIHSTLALLIASLLVCHLWVNTGWKRAVLILSVLPIVCLTNGLRIFTISVLSVYVNPIFFESNLHRRGGVLFFLLALLLLAGVTKLLGRTWYRPRVPQTQ